MANLIFSDGFESGDFSAWNNSGYSIVQSAVKYEGTYALEFDPAHSSGDLNTSVSFPDTKRIYLSHYRRFATGYNFTGAGGRHPFRLKSSQNGSLDTNMSASMQFVIFGDCDGLGTCSSEWNSYASFGWTDDTWYHVEIDVQWNTSGQSDGFIKVYLDGVEKINVINQSFSGNDEYFDLLWITSNDDGTGERKYWVDNVEVWDADPVRDATSHNLVAGLDSYSVLGTDADVISSFRNGLTLTYTK